MSSKNARLVGFSPYLNNVIKRELNDLSPQDRSELKKYLKALGREAKKVDGGDVIVLQVEV